MCNKSLNCSIPVGEDFQGWIMFQQISLCKQCDSETFTTDENKSEATTNDEVYIVEICEGKTTEEFKERQSNIEANNAKEVVEPEGEFVKILCAGRGYHAYREIWRPKMNQNLCIRPEKKNLHDPYAMALYANIPGKITDETLVGHIPREISCFCLLFHEIWLCFVCNCKTNKVL